MSKHIVLIDKKDKVIGFGEKYETHRVVTNKIPVSLHRAISIVIFNKDKSQMLIAKRAESKPTWGGIWSNAVCTHPYPNETYQNAAERRLFEELGIKTKLSEAFNFIYEAKMSAQGESSLGGGDCVWGEHELDHVFTGFYEGEIKADPNEISEFKWIKIEDLKKNLKENPNKYTPWFKIILEKLNV